MKNDYIKIDVPKLDVQKVEFQKTIKEMKDVFTQIKTETSALKEDWSSKTATAIYEDFDNFEKAEEEVLEQFDRQLNFLETIVKKSYVNQEQATTRLIDEKIAIERGD